MKKVGILKNFFYFLLPVLILLLLLHLNTNFEARNHYSSSQYVLDTLVTVRVYDKKKTTAEDVSEVFELLKSYEKVFDFYSSESSLSMLNGELLARNSAYLKEKSMLEALEVGLKVAEETNGAFDPTIGFLTRVWGFDKGGRLPEKEEIIRAVETSGYENVMLDGSTVIVKKKLMIDLGGIAKGYCLDKAAELLFKKGYRKFLINSVSSTVVFNSVDKFPFRIGVEHPRKKGFLAIIYAPNGYTVSTSADNQRYFIRDGKRYHHILNPETGYPAHQFSSLTVMAKKSAAETDALSTALFVMGPKKALSFAKEKGVYILGVTTDGKMVIHPRTRWFEIVAD